MPSQSAADKLTVFLASNSDGDVNAFLNEIDIAIREGDVHHDLGPHLHEAVKYRQYMKATEGHRQIEPEPSARLLRPACHIEFDFFEVGQNPHATRVEGLAFVCEGNAAGRTLKQAHTKAILEPHHAFAYGRARQAQLLRSNRETSSVGDTNECGKVCDAVNGHSGTLIAHLMSQVKSRMNCLCCRARQLSSFKINVP